MGQPAFLDGSPASHQALREVVDRLLRALETVDVGADGAWAGTPATELRAAIDELTVLPDDPTSIDHLVETLESLLLPNAVRPWRPSTIAHLHPPTLLAAAATEALIGSANQSMDSFDQGPAATFLEDHLSRSIAELIGLPSTATGIMTAGGTASNILGMVLARERFARELGLDVAEEGLPPEASSWRIVTSAASHFSVARAAMLLGLGRQAILTVPTDSIGALSVAALDDVVAAAQAAGERVIAIVGTAGTTDLGAFDPLAAIADRAERLGAWFHVDAAVGGAFALSDRLVSRLDGIERAASVTIDLHKLWWQPISASMLLVRDEAAFELIRRHSDYLDRDDDVAAGVLNLVGRSLDTSRRFDSLKAFVSLRHVGRRQLAAWLDHLVDLAHEVAQVIDRRPGLELLTEPQSVMVLFRWVGETPPGAEARDKSELDRINTEIGRRLFESGDAVIGRTVVDGRVALKLTLMAPTMTLDEVVGILDLVLPSADEVL